MPVLNWGKKYVIIKEGVLNLKIPITFYTAQYPHEKEIVNISPTLNNVVRNDLLLRAKLAVLNKIISDMNELNHGHLKSIISSMIVVDSQAAIVFSPVQSLLTIQIPTSYYSDSSWLRYYFQQKQFSIYRL